MREQLWDYFVELGHKTHYYKAYKLSASRISNLYTGLLMLTSAAGVMTLSYWDNYPTIWAGVIILSQALQALKPLFKSSNQVMALKYVIQDMSEIFSEMAAYWDFIDDKTDEQVGDALSSFKMRVGNADSRFLDDIEMPRKKPAVKYAKRENSVFFWYRYSVKIREQYDEQEEHWLFNSKNP